MLPVMTVAQMRAIDEESIGGNRSAGYTYMLTAGTGLYHVARELVPENRSGAIAIVCGKGNNGGDGYVAGRLLLKAGYPVRCFSLCDPADLVGEARIAFEDYVGRKGSVQVLDDAAELPNLSPYRLVIDAMLGTGTRGDPRDLCALMIAVVNESGVPVLAVDTPSGLDCDSGVPGMPCVKASATVTMGYPKIGLYFHPGRARVGRLIVQDIGYPEEIVREKAGGVFVPTPERLAEMVPPRKEAGSKIDHGLVLLVAGSRGMTGSATLAATAAMRSGCGMVHLASPSSAVPVLACKLTEPVLHGVAETPDGAPAGEACGAILEMAGKMQAVGIGPGLTHGEEAGKLVRSLVSGLKKPVVLDADGLNAYKGHLDELAGHAGDLVITPHRGEWLRLFGDLPTDPVNLVQMLKEKAYKFRMTVLLKGNPTVCADRDGTGYILPYGTSALAKAGTGDVLTGIIVSLIAQGAKPTDAAILGCYLQGEAGIAAGEVLGEYAVVASDVVERIGQVIRKLRPDTVYR